MLAFPCLHKCHNLSTPSCTQTPKLNSIILFSFGSKYGQDRPTPMATYFNLDSPTTSLLCQLRRTFNP